MRVAVLKPVRPRARGYADVEVRFAAVYDIPYIRRLAVDALGDLCPSGRDVDRDMLREYTERTMKDSIEDRASGKEIVLVAGAPDSDAAGFLLARQEEDFFYGTTQLSVVNIVVRPSSRGLKVAGALFNRLLEIAIERGIEEITGTIAMSNRRSWLYFDKIWSAKEERKILVKKLRG
jgi:ribosomal protein S18 acetylase RimI-like enzyme